MDNSHLFDADDQQDRIDKMPLNERVKRGYWPEYLSIKEICNFLYPVPDYTTKPDDKSKVREWRSDCSLKKKDNTRFKELLINACKDGLLEYKKVAREIPFIPSPGYNSFLYDDRDIPGKPRPTKTEYYPPEYTIHKDEFKRYLKSIEVWPINGLLANWWAGDKEAQTQTVPPLKASTKKNKLSCLIWRVYLCLIKTNQPSTAQAVWNEIRYHSQTYDEDKIIQEVTATVIYWESTDSKSPSLSRDSFDSKLSKLRADPPF